MKKLRLVHSYVGCFFAPLILYFALSGMWQVFRFNDLPRAPKAEDGAGELGQMESRIRGWLHELSKPHKDSTAPGENPREKHSAIFDWLAAAAGFGLFFSTVLGLIIAFQMPRTRRVTVIVFGVGLLVPFVVLYLGL